MRRLGVYADFVTEDYRRQIDEAAKKAGFSASFFENQAALAAEIGEMEVLFGYIPPALLVQAKKLRWFCAASAGWTTSWRTSSGPGRTVCCPTPPGRMGTRFRSIF